MHRRGGSGFAGNIGYGWEAKSHKVVEMADSRLDSCLTEIDHLTSMLETITDVIEYDNGKVGVSNSTSVRRALGNFL